MHLIGKVLKEPKKDIIIASQNILIRAGYFVLDDKLISLPLGNMLIKNIMEKFLQLFNSTQEVDMGISVKKILNSKFFSEFIKAEFNSHKSIPNSFYYNNNETNDSYNTSKGLISSRYEKMLHIINISDTFQQIELSDYLLSNYNIKTMKALHNGSEQIYTPFVLGDDKYLLCNDCDYNSRKDLAIFDKNIRREHDIREIERVHTPACKTIEEVANYLNVPTSRTAKAVFYTVDNKLVFAVIRGDLDINEMLLMQVLGVDKLETATEEQIIKVGAVPGYASPVNISEKCIIIIDDSIAQSSNLVAGANELEYHLKNVNFDRDFNCDYIANIAVAREGDRCVCGGELKEITGVPLVDIDIIENDKHRYINTMGKPRQLIVSVNSFHLHKIIAMIAENNHDEHGLIIPESIAPFDGILISLLKTDKDRIDEINQIIDKSGKKFIVDDRKLKPGIKFIEADIRGYPIRLIISDKLLSNNEIEIKYRGAERSVIKISELKRFLK